MRSKECISIIKLLHGYIYCVCTSAFCVLLVIQMALYLFLMYVQMVKYAYHVTTRTNPPFNIYTHGTHDYISEMLINRGTWNAIKLIAPQLRKYAETDKIFVDIGANIGSESLYAAALGYSVVSFEADYENARLFQRSIKLNNFSSKVQLVEGIIAPQGVYQKKSNRRNMGANSFIRRRTASNGAGISNHTIDPCDILARKNIGLIKLDCEGCEHFALQRIGKCLTTFPECVFVEVTKCKRKKSHICHERTESAIRVSRWTRP